MIVHALLVVDKQTTAQRYLCCLNHLQVHAHMSRYIASGLAAMNVNHIHNDLPLGGVSCILLIFMLISVNAISQTFLGLSLNVGNSVKFSPSSPGMNSPPMPSASIVLNFRENLQHDWVVQFGFHAGIIGYMMSVHTLDSLAPDDHVKYPFPEYSTFYGGINLAGGKDIPLGYRKLFVGLGAGVDYTYSGWSSSYKVIQGYPDGTSASVFYAETEAIDRFNGFAKVVTQLPLNGRITLGLEYSQHFSSILKGQYWLFHSTAHDKGQISLYQHEISVVFLYRISKVKAAH
jgi:hypothetical protein